MTPQVFHFSRRLGTKGVAGVAGEIDAVADRHRTGGAGTEKRGVRGDFPASSLRGLSLRVEDSRAAEREGEKTESPNAGRKKSGLPLF